MISSLFFFLNLFFCGDPSLPNLTSPEQITTYEEVMNMMEDTSSQQELAVPPSLSVCLSMSLSRIIIAALQCQSARRY